MTYLFQGATQRLSLSGVNSCLKTTRASLEPWFWSSREHHFCLASTRQCRLAAQSLTSRLSTCRNLMDRLDKPLKAIQVMSLTYCSSHSWVPWGSFAPTHAQQLLRSRTRPQMQIQLISTLMSSSPDVWYAEVASGRCPRLKSNSPRRWVTARLISKTSSQLHRGSHSSSSSSRCHQLKRHRATSSRMMIL